MAEPRWLQPFGNGYRLIYDDGSKQTFIGASNNRYIPQGLQPGGGGIDPVYPDPVNDGAGIQITAQMVMAGVKANR